MVLLEVCTLYQHKKLIFKLFDPYFKLFIIFDDYLLIISNN